MSEEVKMNLFEKMLAIQDEMETVSKNLNVSVGKGGSYKAVSEGDVLRAVKPLEAKYKVFSYPYNRKVIENQVIVNEYDKRSLFLRIEVTYRFINVEKPDEFIDVITYGDGVDSQDKATGKAMTYADKYALLKAYKIETGDDPDKDGSKDLKEVVNPKEKIKVETLNELVNKTSEEEQKKILAYYQVKSLTEISEDVAQKMLEKKRV